MTSLLTKEEHQRAGFPSIAVMASKKQWIPLRNLAIRRAIPAEEVDAQHGGKTAVQWAMFYGELGLAKELLYLVHVSSVEPALNMPCMTALPIKFPPRASANLHFTYLCCVFQNDPGTDGNLASRFFQHQEEETKRTEKKVEELCEKLREAMMTAVEGMSALDLEIKKMHDFIVNVHKRVLSLEEARADDSFVQIEQNEQ